MKKIRVAFFAEILIADFDGASRTMFQIIDRIPKDQFEFVFFCAVPPKREIGFEVVKVPSVKIPFNNTYKMGFPFFSTSKIYQKLKVFNPDIIHFASPTPLANLAKKYAQKNNVPVSAIYHTHFMAYIKYYFRQIPLFIPTFEKIAIKLTSKFYKDPDRVYVPTQQIQKELTEKCQIKREHLKIWPRGIDQQLFNPQKKDKSSIQNITSNNFPTILFASRLVWEKNLQALIKLYKLYEQKTIPINFIVAGDGVAKKAAMQAMPKAHFLGMLDHKSLSILYASADVYFFPSDTETFGNVIIEAMASGIPCVAADGGGPKDIIKNDVNGFLCPANDIEDYFKKIQLLLENKELRERIIKAGLKTTTDLNWDNLVEVYFNDLRQLTANRKSTTSLNYA